MTETNLLLELVLLKGGNEFTPCAQNQILAPTVLGVPLKISDDYLATFIWESPRDSNVNPLTQQQNFVWGPGACSPIMPFYAAKQRYCS